MRSKKEAKPTEFISWAQRARQLRIPIPPQQETIEAELASGGPVLPTGWAEMSSTARREFLQWRGQQQLPNARQYDVPRNRRPAARLGTHWQVALEQRAGAAPPIYPGPPSYHLQLQLQAHAAHGMAGHAERNRQSGLDPEWVREVSQAIGEEGLQQVQQDHMRALHPEDLDYDEYEDGTPVAQAFRRHMQRAETLRNVRNLARRTQEQGTPARTFEVPSGAAQ
jgi:hypothetical protein